MSTELFIPKTPENLRRIKYRFGHPNLLDIRQYDAESFAEHIRVYIRHPELDIEPQLTIHPYGFDTYEEAEKYILSKIQK